MTTISLNQLNQIKKEAISKFINELSDLYYSNPALTMDMVNDAKDSVFKKLEKRQQRCLRKGISVINLTVHDQTGKGYE